MRGLEFGLFLFALDGHLASDWLLRVFLVVGELGQRLIVASLWRVRWPKWFVVLSAWSCFRRGWPVRDRWVLFKDLAIGVEGIGVLGALREVLILQLGVMVLALRRRKVLRSVIVVLHVRNSAAKGHLPTDLASLNWISQDVTWLDHNLTWVLLTSEVLLYLNEVGHVLVSRLDLNLDHALWLEGFLVSNLNLMCSVLLTA